MKTVWIYVETSTAMAVLTSMFMILLLDTQEPPETAVVKSSVILESSRPLSGSLHMGVFVRGVLSTRSALVIGFSSFVARVRAGAEVRSFPSA